ncbi:MAG: hypothetical protein DRP87_17630 [Spirochaetes bacterium]|nr:MAG: hypothetical protein DRP87_17630 [Spirochaetota bacterium]
MFLIPRLIQKDISTLHGHPRGRLLVITGARQSGKTTLARMAFPDYPVIQLDSPVERSIYEKMTPEDWIVRYPRAVLDEIQKLPPLFDTVKACYDRNKEVRYILLGSSHFLLLKSVRETLAGRAAIRELYPFTLPELMAIFGEIPPESTKLLSIVRSDNPGLSTAQLLSPTLPLERRASSASMAWDYFLKFGGMPAILGEEWKDEDRFQWLRDYHESYLQRDLSDLAKLDRLEPFVRAQRAAALRATCPINFSELARLADISPPTARQFLRYLEISYQIILLQGWYRNPEKRMVKQPKLYFLDPGIMRTILQKRGLVNGQEFENGVVAETYKQIASFRLPIQFSHFRTTDGREVDLLLEREDGYIAIECKQAESIARRDLRHLLGLQTYLDKPVLLVLLVSCDTRPRKLVKEPYPVWNVAAWQLLS